MGTITTHDLEKWAGRVDARYKLGELIERLIHAGIALPQIRKIEFLSNEANELPGWDGLLQCSATGPWIPDGNSVWELGSGVSSRSKVKADFSKRDEETKLPEGWTRESTTYVAVSLGKFQDRSDLEKDMSAGSDWLDVRVIDAVVFEAWIASHLSVESWLQGQNVGRPSTVISLERYWSDWSEATDPPVSPEMLLCGRKAEAENLLAILEQDSSVIRIKSDSPEESVAFFSAALSLLNDDESRNLGSKCIVVKDPADAHSIVDLPGHIVCLSGNASTKTNELARRGHKIVHPLGRSTRASHVDVELKRPLRDEFGKALESMGVSAEVAEMQARACGSSASIWRVWNQLDRGGPDHGLPEWAAPDHADIVIPAILAGGWSENNEADKEQMRMLSGLEYQEFRDTLQRHLSYDNPLLQKVGDAWVVSAPATAFAITINGITPTQLERLRSVVRSVFTEIDPTIDLPPNERMYAGIKSQELSHSIWLRDGLTESLLQIAVLGERLEQNFVIPDGQSRQQYVDAAITELIGLSEDWRLITSLRQQLPVLAEAAPMPFLKALDRLLQGHPESIKPVFEEGDSFSGHSLHSNILWALEALAWEPQYLPRVSLILARMAELDPGGRLSNRPINSLKEIFLASNPGTAAKPEERFAAIDLILKQVPVVGWDLLIALMPRGTGVSHNTNKPIWRDLSRSDKPVLTRGDVWRTYKEYFDKAIATAEKNATRLAVLLDAYENVSDDEQAMLRNALRRLSEEVKTAEDRKLVWEKLRHVVSRHSSFAEAKWALPKEKLDELEEIQNLFLPDDPIDNSLWLFDEHMPDLPAPREDHRKNEKAVERLRTKAVEAIVDRHGIAGLLDLVDRVQFPGLAGSGAAAVLGTIDEALPVVSEAVAGTRGQQIFGQALSSQMLDGFGIEWRSRILKHVSAAHDDPDILARPFLMFRIDDNLMDFVAGVSAEFEKAFWAQCGNWNVDREKDALERAIRKFIANGRGMEVLMLVGNELKVVDQEIGYETLEALLAESAAGKKLSNYGNSSYYIEKIFEFLSKAEECDLAKLARLEYAYLPLLHMRHGDGPLILHKHLAAEPSFFVDVLSDLYKAEGKKEARSADEEAVSRASRAWEMLHSWNYPPGLQDDGSIDPSELREWVQSVRKLAQEADRPTLAEHHVGQILYHLPRDESDGHWPTSGVREVVDELLSEEARRGFNNETVNARGVTHRGMYEGGNQERALAAKWADSATAMATEWPSISELCREVSESWTRYAEGEDERAEKDRLKYQ